MNIEDLHINFHYEDSVINETFFNLVYEIHTTASTGDTLPDEMAMDMVGQLIEVAEDLTIETEIKKLQNDALQAVNKYNVALDEYYKRKYDWYALVDKFQKALKRNA